MAARGRTHLTQAPDPGLEGVELRAKQRAARHAPPPADAFAAGAYPAVLSGAATTLVGVIMVVAAASVLVDASRLPSASDPLGPAAFPLGIGVLLGLIGLALAIANHRYALVWLRVRRGGVVRRGNGLRTALMLGALLVFAAVLPSLGFFVPAVLLYVCVAMLLEAPRGWHLPITGILLAGVIVLLFDRVIGLTLPAGPWGF